MENSSDIAVIKNEIKNINETLEEIKNKLENKFITHEEFEPVKNIVYGLVATILIAFIGAVITLVIKS